MISRFTMLLHIQFMFLFMAEQYCIVCLYPSSPDGYLGGFHLLAIVNKSAVNIVYKYLLEFLLSILSMYLEELLDHVKQVFLSCLPCLCFAT